MHNDVAIKNSEFVYHGTITGGIKEFEKRKRYVPGGADVPARIYAAINPAFAAAHSFPWSSDEGIDIKLEDNQVILCVPRIHENRLYQRVYIYKLKRENFVQTKEELTGQTFHTEEKVQPEEVMQFNSVTEALMFYGGKVEIYYI